jgi:thioredoxin reductase
MDWIESDVLIIGSGGAALRAAIEAKESFPDGRVTILTKGEMENLLIIKDEKIAMKYAENWKEHANHSPLHKGRPIQGPTK